MLSRYEIIGYPLFFVAGLELLLGFMLVKQNPANSRLHKTAAALAFFSAAFALCTGIMYLRASLGLPYNAVARANWIGWFSIPAAAQFIYYLKDDQSRAARLVGYTLYPFWFLMLCLSLFTDLIVTDTYVLIPYVNEPGPLENPVRLFGTGLILWALCKVVRLKQQSSGLIKKELAIFFYGILIFGGGTALASGLLQLFGGFGLEPGLGSYFSLPWVLLTFYSIARYRLFDLRIIVSRSVGTVLLALIFSAVQTILFLLLQPSLGPVFAIFISLPVIGFFFFGTTLSWRLQTWVNSLILRDRYEYQEVLRGSTKAMATMLALDDLLDHIMESVRKSLGVKHVCLFLAGKDGVYARRDPGARGPRTDGRSLAGMVVEWLQATRQSLIRELQEALQPDAQAAGLATYLRGINAELLVPIFYQNRLLGVLSLGAKGNRESYTQSDIVLLETLAGHAAVAIENATLFAETVRVKESLQESEGKFRALAETIPAAIFIHQGGNFLYANPAGETLSGYAMGEILGMDFLRMVHPDFREMIRDRAAGRLAGSRQPSPYEFKIVRKDGDERWVIMSAGIMEYQGKPSVIGTLFDITERKNLEERLFSMQKMEAIGKLAGGVAHDFNNILSSIVGQGSLLQAGMRTDDPLQSHIDRILTATERAAALTQRLLTYGTRKESFLQPLELAALVRQQEKFLTGVLRGDIRLFIRVPGEGLPVLADAAQIERVILNLVGNARDAMPQGGDIVIESGARDIDAEFVRTQGYGRPGRYAFFSVQDTGIGMDPVTRRRIFDPFFTTKGTGKGTGLGLSIVFDIVKEHQGFLAVESAAGKGARFTVFLPLITGVRELEIAAGAAALRRGTETILVADDDETSRKHIRTVLEEHGYRVIEAEDGEDALKKYRKFGDRIHLVITDVIMPRANGRDVFNGVRSIRGQAKVLFISGYTEDLLKDTGILVEHQPFLLKPASQQDLLDKTREVLDGRVPVS